MCRSLALPGGSAPCGARAQHPRLRPRRRRRPAPPPPPPAAARSLAADEALEQIRLQERWESETVVRKGGLVEEGTYKRPLPRSTVARSFASARSSAPRPSGRVLRLIVARVSPARRSACLPSASADSAPCGAAVAPHARGALRRPLPRRPVVARVRYGGKAGALGRGAALQGGSSDAGVHQKGKRLAQWVGDEGPLASAPPPVHPRSSRARARLMVARAVSRRAPHLHRRCIYAPLSNTRVGAYRAGRQAHSLKRSLRARGGRSATVAGREREEAAEAARRARARGRKQRRRHAAALCVPCGCASPAVATSRCRRCSTDLKTPRISFCSRLRRRSS